LEFLYKVINMETITIPRDEYFELIDLYRRITQKIEKIEKYQSEKSKIKKLNALKYCNAVLIQGDIIKIQKQMRDEWK